VSPQSWQRKYACSYCPPFPLFTLFKPPVASLFRRYGYPGNMAQFRLSKEVFPSLPNLISFYANDRICRHIIPLSSVCTLTKLQDVLPFAPPNLVRSVTSSWCISIYVKEGLLPFYILSRFVRRILSLVALSPISPTPSPHFPFNRCFRCYLTFPFPFPPFFKNWSVLKEAASHIVFVLTCISFFFSFFPLTCYFSTVFFLVPSFGVLQVVQT